MDGQTGDGGEVDTDTRRNRMRHRAPSKFPPCGTAPASPSSRPTLSPESRATPSFVVKEFLYPPM